MQNNGDFNVATVTPPSARLFSPAMRPNITISWRDAVDCIHHGQFVTSAFGARAPSHITTADDTTAADTAYRQACEGTALVWQGDYQNARQLLQAMARRLDTSRNGKRRLKTSPPSIGDPALFHAFRQAQSARAKVLGMLWVPLTPTGIIALRRAPDIAQAINEAFGCFNGSDTRMISLREVLGVVGAAQWRKRGVSVPTLGANALIHPHYGVFSPVRSEYIDLVEQAPMPPNSVAWDIGTGTGVLAALLVRRGAVQVVATDISAQALTCAHSNLMQLGLKQHVQILHANLFPSGKANIIICNPPWLPGKPTSAIEYSVYDQNSQMLKGFLQGLRGHLSLGGEGWLILSDLAERLGLRAPQDLSTWIAQAGLYVVDRLQTRARHKKVACTKDLLHIARDQEITSLWRLASA